MSARTEAAEGYYNALAAGDREKMESFLAADFTYTSPYDNELNTGPFFDRIWPHQSKVSSFDFVRVVEHGDEVIITYELTWTIPESRKARSTEVMTFNGDLVSRIEVYFGWDVPHRAPVGKTLQT